MLWLEVVTDGFALFHDGVFHRIGLLKDAEAGLWHCWGSGTEQHRSRVSAKAPVRL